MEKKKNVLFICVHNSGRSQMAEAFLQNLGGNLFHVESAGLEPKNIQNIVIEVMKEKGIDVSENTSDSVFDFYKQGRLYDVVITVCDEASAERCPTFPGPVAREHWGFPDPSAATGSHAEKLAQVRQIRDAIRQRITDWCRLACLR